MIASFRIFPALVFFGFIGLIALSSPLSAMAQTQQGDEWRPMTQDEAEAWIYNQTLIYTNGATQYFVTPTAPGEAAATEYVDGRPTFGEYTVIDGQYCSVWPQTPPGPALI